LSVAEQRYQAILAVIAAGLSISEVAGKIGAAGLVRRATSRPVCGVFGQVLTEFGAPQEVLTDNGKVFTGVVWRHSYGL
jgi:hypothetical protein